VLFPPGSQNKTQVAPRGLTDNGLEAGKGESCLTRRDPQLPSINVPGDGHSVSTELILTQKTQLVVVIILSEGRGRSPMTERVIG
jgi:hypothetical protein